MRNGTVSPAEGVSCSAPTPRLPSPFSDTHRSLSYFLSSFSSPQAISIFFFFRFLLLFSLSSPIPYSFPPPCFSPLLFSLVSLPEENCVSLICFIGTSNSSASLYTQLFFVIQIPQRLLKNNFWYICFGYLLIFPFLHNCDLNFN